MIGAQLKDTVTIRSERTGSDRPDDMTLRAHVYTVSGSNPREPNRPGLLVESLRAIVGPPPRPISPAEDLVEHHGTVYQITGPPMGRYRNGRLHHWTIELERTTG